MTHPFNFDRPVYMLLGLPVDCVNTPQAIAGLEQAALNRTPCFLSTPNLNFLVASHIDPAFRLSVIDSDLVVADGMPLVWAAKWMGIPLPERVAGSTLVELLRHSFGSRRALKVFFFGGPEGIAAKASQILAAEKSGLTGVGAYYPGFGTVDDMCQPEVVAQINAAQPDVVIVSLGAKKGQQWIQRMRGQLEAPVISHLGAVVNFIAGTVARAPVWMQRTGLEWVWRMYEEPSLFKRYWTDGKAYLTLLWNNVLPVRQQAQKNAAFAASLSPVTVRTQNHPDGSTQISLEGRATEPDLAVVRETFKSVCGQGAKSIEINLAQCQYADSAFMGLLCLLLKHQRQTGQTLRVTGASAFVKQQFALYGAGFLL
jgi:N-acetylglucosaminyldiphosphoundecaprenol N-acetyl-beta-D-mannosaminyltransferase